MSETTCRPACRYKYELLFMNDKGEHLRRVPLSAHDFARAESSACFDGFRKGSLARYDPGRTTSRIEPRFSESSVSPVTDGFRVAVTDEDGHEHVLEVPTSFFTARGRRIGRELRAAGCLGDTGTVFFSLCAYDASDDGMERPGGKLGVAIERSSCELRVESEEGSPAPLDAWDEPEPEDLPLVIPMDVFEDALADARHASTHEMGGILLGHIYRDRGSRAVRLEVTSYVPAEETVASETRLTFTEETFAKAREVMDLRGRGELCVGWLHSHPFSLCAKCPLPTPRECVDKVLSFSIEDEQVMERAFSEPYMIGVLVGIDDRLESALGHVPVRVYGWRRGELTQRGFHVLGRAEEASGGPLGPEANGPPLGGETS